MTVSPGLERRLATFLPPLLVGLFALPFILYQNSWWEWTTAFWLLERQADHVSAHGVPTFFLHTESGLFDGFYVFYAGFTFSALAYPAALVGAWPVFAATCVATLMAGYLGVWWTARNLGLSHRLAILPALAFAATPYMLSDLYGRGSWAELVGANTAAVLLGAFTALLCNPKPRHGGALAGLVASGAMLAGTHNLSLLMSALTLPFILGALLPLASRTVGVRAIARRLAVGVGAIALGVGLTGAWLIPNLWLGPGTFIASSSSNASMIANGTFLVTLSNVLSPLPRVPPGFDGSIYAQVSVLALAWAVAALTTALWSRRRRLDRVALTSVALLAIGAALLVIIVRPLWWLSFPRLLQTVQNPVRLLPYLAIVISLAIAVALTAMPRGRARQLLVIGLVAAVGIQTAVGVFIAVDTKASATLPGAPLLQHKDVVAATEPPAFSMATIAAHYQFRVLNHPLGPQPRRVANARIHDIVTSDRATVSGTGRVGERLKLPVVRSPLVHVDGDARVTGRNEYGNMIVTITHTDAGGRWSATVRPACSRLCLDAVTGDAPWQLLMGRLLTLVSLVVLGVVIAAGIRRRRAASRRPPPVSASDLPSQDVPQLAPTPAS
jgi:hypothetical protein